MLRPSLTIDLDAVVKNWCFLQSLVRSVCGAVVKADAYGIGSDRVVPALAAHGCRWFFVAQIDEAIAVKRNVLTSHVVCLGGILPNTEAELVENRIIPTLNSLEDIIRWREQAQSCERHLPAVIHLDTGMNRLGLEEKDILKLIDHSELFQGLDVWVWMSHFACADEPQCNLTYTQYQRFSVWCERLPVALRSLANSSGIFRDSRYHCDIVRPGCALYGINPMPETSNPMHRVAFLYAPVLQIRTVHAPTTVGYGATYRVNQTKRLATVGLGYADGYLRALSNIGHVFIQEYQAPVVGRVSMDTIIVDVTDIPESVMSIGMNIELFGHLRTLDDLAANAGTIPHEILTSLGERCQRHYLTSDEKLWNF